MKSTKNIDHNLHGTCFLCQLYLCHQPLDILVYVNACKHCIDELQIELNKRVRSPITNIDLNKLNHCMEIPGCLHELHHNKFYHVYKLITVIMLY